MTAAAEFQNAEKIYRPGPFGTPVPAVRGVTLTIPTGCVFGLLGPNRAGKTTLIKLLLSLARPTGGAVRRLGSPVSDRRTLARVGYMHENHAFPRYLSAGEVLHFYGGLSGLTAPELAAKVPPMLEKVGLADRGKEPISRFSKGMVQRLGLAQATLTDPDLLVLDEPTEGLDLAGRQLLRDTLRATAAAGKTVILVSHVLAEVEELCDELAVIVAGKLAYRGLPADLRAGKPTFEAGLRAVYEEGAAV